METFFALLAFVRGIHRSQVNSPHKGQWREALMFSSICCLNQHLSKHWRRRWFETPSRSLWRHCNEGGSKIKQLQNTAKHSKAWTMYIFPIIYCYYSTIIRSHDFFMRIYFNIPLFIIAIRYPDWLLTLMWPADSLNGNRSGNECTTGKMISPPGICFIDLY